MDNFLSEKASVYDKTGVMKVEVDKALVLLKDFRAKYPFAENPQSIDWLNPDDIFKESSGEAGEFFRYLEYSLEPLGHLTIQGSAVYRNIRIQLGDFKSLLRVAVDKKKSLAEKVDARWENISRLGQDKQVAKKIIFCFNYESGKMLPIFSTAHLKYFVNKVVDKPSNPRKYYSLGEEYASLTSELLTVKENLPKTKTWEITYFARFLYNSYPPPDQAKGTINPSDEERKAPNIVTREQVGLGEFVKLLGTLQTKGKITGQQFRENRELWIHQPTERESLTQRLKKILSA